MSLSADGATMKIGVIEKLMHKKQYDQALEVGIALDGLLKLSILSIIYVRN